jgi:esterase/lipase superfamily enzyme
MTPLQPDDGKVVKVWYATNRSPTTPFDGKRPYGIERARVLSYGSCLVLIPASHVRGTLTSYNYKKWRNESIRFLFAEQLDRASFLQDVAARLRTFPAGDRSVLVFIHGYNNTFEETAIRTAQIWADLEVPGIAAFFSWPSRGSTAGYVADEASIEASEPYLHQFLVDISRNSGATKVHVIAHSMGNRAFLRVISQAVSGAQRESGVKFGQIFLAAPDVDLDVFNRLASVYPIVADRTTLYVSKQDRAVLLSAGSLVHDYPRAGGPPPFASVDRIDTIEVRAPRGLLDLGHSYFAEFGPVLDDLRSLILTSAPSSSRRRDGSVWVLEPR